MIALKKDKTSHSKFVSINSTQHNTTLLMHAEDKNLHGKIFGGYVLKLAYELAWVCVYKFLKGGIPVVTNIDDVQFLAPVEVGTTLDYTASICYIENNLIHVVVNCKNTKANG
jgi:acyl-coenzyme A thioesterase 9